MLARPASAAAEDAVTAVAAPADEPGIAANFRGSDVSLRTDVLAIGLDKAADPTWNPNVEMSLSATVRYTLNPRVRFNASSSLSRELTQSDWTTYQGETMVGDTQLGARYAILLPDPVTPTGLSVSSDLGVNLPTSKASAARSLIIAPSLGVTAAWSSRFAGQGLQLSLSGRGTYMAHQYTTGQLDSPWVVGCADLTSGCSQFSHTGLRNPEWRWTGLANATWTPLSSVAVTATAGVHADQLYALGTAKGTTYTVEPDPNDPSQRVTMVYVLEASWDITDVVNVSLGAQTVNSQLAPDSTYQSVFINRFTNLYLNLQIAPAELF
jgi:hypothetical protein